MKFNQGLVYAAAFAGLLSFSTSAFAATEVCGDGIDNDFDGFADNGCYPVGVTGVCESPLACAQTGAVAPDTGQLVYHEPPDLSPTVPYGPPITLRRQYMSQYEPGYNDPSDTDYTAPLGYGWHHNFMSWVKIDSGASDEVMLHSVSGQDILFTRVSTSGGYHTYQPQVGFHFDYLRRRTAGGANKDKWELRTLSGQIYNYDVSEPIAKLVGIEDAAGNEVVLTYYDSGCEDGQLKRVTDASGNKYIEFTYHSSTYDCTVDYVKYYAAGTERVEVDYDYRSGENYELKYVYVGADPARLYDYDANHKLTSIDVRSGDYVADVFYITTAGKPAGKVARIETGRGVLGYEYGMQQKDCTRDISHTTDSGTCVYYHRKNTTACSADSGSNYCGGEQDPGTGTTGRYFRATRWIGYSNANEDLIDSVASSCTNCTDVAQYDWDTGTGGDELLLDGTKDAENVWTSYERNSDGLVTKMVTNDTDGDASTVPAGARAKFYLYGNSTYPGLVTEVRRQSELKTTTACDASTTTDCKRTIYAYTSDGLLDTVQEKGFTYSSSAAVVAYDFTTDWDYDSKGRVTKYKGPRTDTSYDVTDYTYHTTTGLEEGYRKETKRQKASATFITTTRTQYDEWGNAVDIKDPNGDFTCLKFDAERNVLTERRIAMNAQTSCVTTHADDLKTTFAYDSDVRLTKVTKPLGNCIHRTYDSWGRVQYVKPRDDCSASSSGHTLLFTYSDSLTDDGLTIGIKYSDALGATTYENNMTYTNARRLETAISKGITNTKKTFAYEADGQLASISDEDFGNTDYAHDAFGQLIEISRLLVGTTTRDWNLTGGSEQDLPTKVEDPASLDMDLVWDDLGRKVKQLTQESGTTIYLYDPAGNLTTRIEDDGGSDEMTNTFTYDSLNRITAADYGDADCFTLGDEEINYTYDTVTGCPSGRCTNAEGRLVKVETLMACDDSEAGDDGFDQQTYFGYDNSGRVLYESIEDDGSRSADQDYVWDKNGNATQAVAPSGAEQNWVNGSGSSNSDADKVCELKRDTTGITTNGKWMPFGPMKEYRQYNKLIPDYGYNMMKFTRDRVYRPTKQELQSETTYLSILSIDYTYDDDGNLASRDYLSNLYGRSDSYYNYDGLDRVTSDCKTSGACTSTTDKKAVLTFNSSGDRTYLFHDNTHNFDQEYTTNYNSGTRQPSTVTYLDGTSTLRTVTLNHDGRGNRLDDDDDQWTRDRRDYTYDARNNLITVQGEAPTTPGESGTYDYTLTNAYDHKNRRIFKSYVNETTSDEAQWFFYYDWQDRLIEIKHTPDISSSSTYSIYQFYYIGQRPIAYWQIDYPSATTTKRYIRSDDLNRPMEVVTWDDWAQPSWALSLDLYAWDNVALLGGIFQPLRFPGQYFDEETQAWVKRYSGDTLYVQRPGLHENRFRYYDPFMGAYMQVDPKVDSTWEAYNYAGQNPVMFTDPTGEQCSCVSVEAVTTCQMIACSIKTNDEITSYCDSEGLYVSSVGWACFAALANRDTLRDMWNRGNCDSILGPKETAMSYCGGPVRTDPRNQSPIFRGPNSTIGTSGPAKDDGRTQGSPGHFADRFTPLGGSRVGPLSVDADEGGILRPKIIDRPNSTPGTVSN